MNKHLRKDIISEEPLEAEALKMLINLEEIKRKNPILCKVLVLKTVNDTFKHANKVCGWLVLETLGLDGELSFDILKNFKRRIDAERSFSDFVVKFGDPNKVFEIRKLVGNRFEMVL